MSKAAPEADQDRVASAAAKRSQRTGRCVVCSCERFELGVIADGYPHCTCRHTQWGHLDPHARNQGDK